MKPPFEFRVMRLRECPLPDDQALGDTPERVATYWRAHVHPVQPFDPERENLVTVFLNTRRRILGHHYTTTGTTDMLLAEPSSVFRPALLAGARAIVIGHNHPSGDPTPSEADIRVTRDFIRAGQILKVELLDHLIFGHPAQGRGFNSLRELGYFYA